VTTTSASARPKSNWHAKTVRSLMAIGLLTSAALASDLAEPEVATAAADANMVPLVPARLLETRSGPDAATIDGQHRGVGKVAARTTYTLDVAGRGGVDPAATAVMLNVTAVFPEDLGYLTVYPCTPEPPQASHVNYFPGDVAPNSVLAKVSAQGTVCVFTLATTDIVIDVTGYVPVGGAPVPLEPARLVETRGGPDETTVDGQFEGVGRAGPGSTVKFRVWDRGGVPADTEAVYLNVTAVYPDAPGFLTVYPCSATVPEVSNVNYFPGDVVPNAVLASVSNDGFVCIFSSAASDIIADVNAYLPPGGNRVSIEPARCADTRPDGKTFDGLFQGDGAIPAGGTYAITIGGRCNIAPDASAAYLNVTAVFPEALGFLTVWPCDEPRPATSNVNYAAGEVRPNSVLSKVSLDNQGQICVFSLATTHIVVDANGYVPAPGLFGIADITSGDKSTCALMTDTSVWCWGEGGYLGDGTNERRYDPRPTSVTGAVQIESGGGYTCARLANSTVNCWGENGHGQLGDGTDVGTDGNAFDKRYSPVAVQGLTNAIDIAAWDRHSCAITDDNGDAIGDTVRCWGDNNYGQLGDGTKTPSFVPVEAVGLPTDRNPVNVDVGGNHTCVLFDDGTVWCWGSGTVLGDDGGPPGSGSAGRGPVEVFIIDDAVDLAAGSSHTCVIRQNATVWCWGTNGDGQVGDGNLGTALVPAQALGVTGARKISTGLFASCATLADGSAKCWGRNDYGQLGDGSPAVREPVPVTVIGVDQHIVNMSTSGRTSCAALADTSAVCWGYSVAGVLGANTPGHSATPVVVGSGNQIPS
jgi:alpha-tubulin suppressor-like RCC1 family protein